MKITIDSKSALCGLIIGIVAMMSIGAGQSSDSAGKYKVATGTSNGKGYAIIIDSVTGKAWCDELKIHNAINNQIYEAGGFWDQK